MRILLVGPDYEENLSLRYLSTALLRAGHETELVAFNSSHDLEPVARAAQRTDLVALSMCFQSRALEYIQLARRIKSVDATKLVVAGGHYASCAAEPLLSNHPEIDLIVIHEGEATLTEIADAGPTLKSRISEVPGIAYREGDRVHFTAPRRTLDDLDALPFPDRTGPIHQIAGIPTSYMMGSRGCYRSCAYCCITTLHRIAPGKRFRQRSSGQVAQEMAELYHERGSRQFIFHDDNFLVPSEEKNQARLSALEQELSRRGVRDIALVIKCRPADAKRNLFLHLKEMGLVRVFMGVEAATPRGLATLERDQTVEDAERALDLCAELDISAQFTLMTFNPDATLGTLRSDLAFMRRYCGNPLNFCRAEIYAGTPLEKRMIALGRTRGNYLAREYSIADPIADRACLLALNLFHERCWTSNSLMQNAIGLDHTAAVLKRFYSGNRERQLSSRITAWLRAVNLDTVDLLEEVIELSRVTFTQRHSVIEEELAEIGHRESKNRKRFLAEATKMRAQLEELRHQKSGSSSALFSHASVRLARQAAAALLAVGIPGLAASQQSSDKNAKPTPPPVSAPVQNDSGISEYAAAQLKPEVDVKDLDVGPLPEATGSLTGTVTDSSGAVIENATVTITNVDTGTALSQKTGPDGKYLASGLKPGRYSVKVEMRYFKTFVRANIEVTPGTTQDVNFSLGVANDIGCCEYAAAPLNVPGPDYRHNKKPFTYFVGEAKDHNTLQGIARVVYGNRRAWVQIYEANRNEMANAEFIPNGTPLVIPPKVHLPKMTSTVVPEYPSKARAEHIWGNVVIEVTLNPDGSVQTANVIAGPPLLAETAMQASRQWRFQLPENPKPADLKFLAGMTFTEGGKVEIAP